MKKLTFITTPQRSRIMAAIRSRGNSSTEQRMVKIMRQHHVIGWRRNANLLGHPDFIFPKQKVAIFVDGCFWHGCPRCYRAPKTNRTYWNEKIERNIARDHRNARRLRSMGWCVLHFWEHSLTDSEIAAAKIKRALDGHSLRN